MKQQLLILFLLVSTLAGAQDSLSLANAIEIGLANNYDIKIERMRVDQAGINNTQGLAGRWPTIDLTFGNTNSINNAVEVAFPQFQPTGRTRSTNLVPGVTVDWVVFSGFRVNIAKSRLDELERQSKGNANIVIANTIEAIILAYYRAVLEKDRLDAFERNLQLSRDKYSLQEARKEIGTAVTTDLLLEESNYLTDSTNYINQALLYRNALRTLNFILAIEEPDTDYEFTNPLEFDHPEYDLDLLATRLENENIDLKTQYIAQQVREYDTRISKSDRWPVVSVFGNANATYTWQNLSDVNFGDSDLPPDVQTESRLISGGFRLSWRLFNGGRINRAIQSTIVEQDITNIATDRLKTSLMRDLAQAHDGYLIKKQLFDINVRREESARMNLEVSTEKYRNGTLSSFNYRTVQNNLILAEINKLDALFNLIEEHVNLLRLTGGIIERYKDDTYTE